MWGGHERHRNDTQIPGSGSWMCGRTLTKEKVQEVERITMTLALGIPNLKCPEDVQWAAGNIAVGLNSEITAAEWPLRCLLEAEAFVLAASVLQLFLSTHWCLRQAPSFPPGFTAGPSPRPTTLEES